MDEKRIKDCAYSAAEPLDKLRRGLEFNNFGFFWLCIGIAVGLVWAYPWKPTYAISFGAELLRLAGAAAIIGAFYWWYLKIGDKERGKHLDVRGSVVDRTEECLNQFYRLGYREGQDNAFNDPNNREGLERLFSEYESDIFQKGYEAGYEDRKNEKFNLDMTR